MTLRSMLSGFDALLVERLTKEALLESISREKHSAASPGMWKHAALRRT